MFYEYNSGNTKAGTGPFTRLGGKTYYNKSDSRMVRSEPIIKHEVPERKEAEKESKVQKLQTQASLLHTPTKDKPKLQSSVLNKSPKRKKPDASPKREALTRTPTRKRKREVCTLTLTR